MKKTSSFIILLLVVSAVAVFFAAKTNVLDNLTPYLKASAVTGNGLSCALQSDSASPPNVSIKSITGGTGNYECNFSEEETSGFPVFSSASCSNSHPSNCTGIGNCPVIATVRDAGVSPKTYAVCSISVTGQGIPATGCPSGFQLNNGVCGIASSTSTTGGTGGPVSTGTTTPTQLPQSSTSIGQIQFGKVFFDTTNLVSPKTQSQLGTVSSDGTFIPGAQDLAIAKFGNKDFLFVLTGGAVNTYDLADPLNPKYVGSADVYSQTAAAYSPAQNSARQTFKKIEVLDNFNYGIIYGSGNYANPREFITIFKINPSTGAISYVAFYDSQTNNPYGLYVGLGMKLFRSGSNVYLVSLANNKNYDPNQGAWSKSLISIFNFSNPESGISQVYQFPVGFGPISQSSQLGVENGVADPKNFYLLNANSKTYLLVASNDGGSTYNVFGYVHAGTDWSSFYDLSDPSNPKKVIEDMSYKLFGWFDYAKGFGLLLNNANSQYIFDPTDGRLYVTSGITQGDSLMGEASPNFEARFNLNVMDFSNAPALKKISDIVIRAAKHLDTYVVPRPVPSIIKSFSGFIDFEYMDKKDSFNTTGAAGVTGDTGDCYNNQFAQFGVEKNGVLTYIADPTNELDKAKDVIQNKDRAMSYGFYQNSNSYCQLTPTAVAILPANSNTLAVYRARNYYVEVDKVTLSSTSLPATTASAAAQTPAVQTVPGTATFSFQNLLNIFKRILNR